MVTPTRQVLVLLVGVATRLVTAMEIVVALVATVLMIPVAIVGMGLLVLHLLTTTETPRK